jgi:hypothetical protein
MGAPMKVPAAAAFLIAACLPLLAHACGAGDARTQAARLMQAAAAFDAATVLELTHPGVFAATSDPAAARDRLRSTYASLKAGGLAEELGVPSLADGRIGRSRVFRAGASMSGAYLSYRAVQRRHGEARPVEGWLLGICGDAGAQWRYVEGRRLDEATMRRFLPGWTGSPPLPSAAMRIDK